MAEFTGIGQGTYNTVAGSIGMAGTLLGSGVLGGLFGNGYGYGYNRGYGRVVGDGHAVDREAFDLSLALSKSQSDNAILASELDAEKKMVDVYVAGERRTKELEHKFEDALKEQAVFNCHINDRVSRLEEKVDQLMGMTKLGIVQSSIWPQ